MIILYPSVSQKGGGGRTRRVPLSVQFTVSLNLSYNIQLIKLIILGTEQIGLL